MKPSVIILAAILILFMFIPKIKVNPFVSLVLLVGGGTLLFFIFSNIDDKNTDV
jgi:H+/gluconate symporter-like permease